MGYKKIILLLFIYFCKMYLEVAEDGDSYRWDESQNNGDYVGLSMVTIVPDLLETDHHNPQGWGTQTDRGPD